jgi:exodeoxyribonuclease V beta subunit
MTVFDLLDAPLNGSNLIEASAGTGKTYNIVGLFVRLVVEKALHARDILVVTYTIAATDELRGRIRTCLVGTLRALDRGEKSGDSFINGFCEKIQKSGRTEVAQRLLRASIRDFDEAPIFTIHSFCWRMLQEHAFESGVPFDTELIPDEKTILLEFTQDFWRQHFYDAPMELAGYALGQGLTPDYYLRILAETGNHRLSTLIPEAPPPEMDQIKQAIATLQGLFGQLKEDWRLEGDAAADLLRRPGLNGRTYGKHVDALLELIETLLTNDQAPFPLPKGFEKITAGKIAQQVNKGHEAPRHPLFDLAQQVQEQVETLTALCEDYLRFLRMDIVRQARMELPKRKERQSVLAYNDLLNNLHDALTADAGPAVIREVRSRFKAVLIDEFQDTDPVQYTIFKTLFLTENPEEQRPFFVIGDPKQAIYAFRGADIFAYIAASNAMQKKYTLGKNWRSEPELLEAVNALFAFARQPFLHEAIQYHTLTAADMPERRRLLIDGASEPPFQWWLVPEETDDQENHKVDRGRTTGGLTRGGLYPRVASTVASECARLIRLGREGRARIGDLYLHAGDIAVLVRTNREADIISQALAHRHIPHVLSSRESVFHSPEATDVLTILQAIAEPKNLPRVRAALVTSTVGMTGDDLHALNTGAHDFETILRRFYLYHTLWESAGFIRMFRAFLSGEHIPSRTLTALEGERRLTNLLHIGELLHQAATTEHLAVHDLIVWLDNQIRSEATHPEEYELRLERDEQAVKVVTIHKSKGLEYPIVFCPFSWGGPVSGRKRDYVLFHDPQQSHEPVVDFGSGDFDDHCRYAEEEALAEEIRLLYVALTRARHRAYFVWGHFRNAGHSAATYLFHQGVSGDANEHTTTIAERYKSLNAETFLQDLNTIVAHAGGTIQLSNLPGAEEKPARVITTIGELACRTFTGQIDQAWKTASYTLLVSSPSSARRPEGDEQIPDHETRPVPEISPTSEGKGMTSLDLFGFPGGVKAGICLHDILEQADYQHVQSDENNTLIHEKLRQYDYDRQWHPILSRMVETVTSLPLPVGDRPDHILMLSGVAPGDRLNEVEFYFPLRKISRHDLAQVFRKGTTMKESALSTASTLQCLERLHFHPLEGYLKGYIDLVFRWEGRFYLADWKSNYLGPRPADYKHEALQKVMDEGFYYIQYHLYALALHQYLALRIPGYRYEDHFGGVYYLFLRGINPTWGSDNGVFFDRPPLALLETMKGMLIRKPEHQNEV